jgi:hypothetical protein
MKKRQHGVPAWRNLDLFWVEDISCCLVSSDHERWIQGKVPPLSTTDAGLALTTFTFSCDEAWSSIVAVAPMQSFGLGQLPPDIKDLLSLHSS